MLDIVLGEENKSPKKKEVLDQIQDYFPEKIVPLVKQLHDVIRLLPVYNSLSNKFKFLSPRIAPIFRERSNMSLETLSPNLFPLYPDSSQDSILSIPEILNASGLNSVDKDSIMELIIEASGTRVIIDNIMAKLEKISYWHIDNDISIVTDKINNAFKAVARTFSKRQKREIDHGKYTFMTKRQILMVFGPNAIYNASNLPFDLNDYENWTDKEKQEAFINKIRIIADEKTAKIGKKRSKRFVSLAPFAFSPSIVQFSILTPIVISPSLFSPSILAPSLLSPPILSPQIGNPLIFSPYLLGPNILSPAIFNAYVFSPYVLAPNVVNPYVLSPLILSPYVLSPDILSPTVLSGSILSPNVLSPSINSTGILAANVLSPTFLS
ncbi:unnamed protein product [Dracunculus medinensis]|uniref:Uncharacterized protein n=1 Tax=Dracunculus medinensis TaxID=318479 RepID=A0A0N4UIS5_DRAME|nr:unnamed protein product [Dracunculus medinensis]